MAPSLRVEVKRLADTPSAGGSMTQRDRDKKDTPDIDLENPLGIAQEPVPTNAADQFPESDDPAAVRRRRARAGLDGNDDSARPGMGDINPDSDGATGIDMGYGGEGTNIKPGR
jgi:hypothetical protein